MDLEQSYRILGISPAADLDEVKRAFRSMAFKLHPDLHPNDPQAARNFQDLNEAYVIATRHIQTSGPKVRKKKTTTAERPQEKQRKPTPPPSSDQDRSRLRFQERVGREDMLRDILSDPFARQVFEDIYRTIRRSGRPTTVLEQQKSGSRSAVVRVRQEGRATGIWSLIKRWSRSQLDYEQEVTLAPELLRPGQTIRFQVARRFSGPPVTLEVTLPPDYVVGRPIRLKGYGRHIGPLKGDLYLRFQPR